MHIYLVHHADAVGPHVDPQRPLSTAGMAHADRLAVVLKARTSSPPPLIWHSGKLRARQTAEALLRGWAPLAEFRMVRGLRPDDPPDIVVTALLGETRDVAVVGHFPHIGELLARLTGEATPTFPPHGAVMLVADGDGTRWRVLDVVDRA